MTKRGITIIADAQSRVYGNANPSLTYAIGGAGLVNGDTLSGTLVTAATVTSNVGAYAIGQGTLSAGSNYNLTYTGNNLNVTQRGITIIADSQSRVYGNANPSLTYVVGGAGLVNGDALSGNLSTNATINSDVGDYAILQGSLTGGTNYSVTSYMGENLSITKRLITVRANGLTSIYGNSNPSLTYVVGGDGLVNGDNLSGNLFTTATVTSNVGDYEITQGTLSASANYQIDQFFDGTLTVIPRSLSVTASDQSRIVGEPNEPLTYTVGSLGLVNGDSMVGDLETIAVQSSPAGNYAITQGTLTTNNTNYTVLFNPGTLIVNASPLSDIAKLIPASADIGIFAAAINKTSNFFTNSTFDGKSFSRSSVINDVFSSLEINEVLINTDSVTPLNEIETNASDRIMQGFYQIYFTKELLNELGYEAQ